MTGKGRDMDRQVEILAPAGSKESLKAAVCAGADAVYTGGAMFGGRAYAKNLAEEELLDSIDYVHVHGRKLYLTVNTLLKDREIDCLYEYLYPYYMRGLDGVIVQDIGVIEFLKRYFPGLALHASTQMTITGADGAAFLKEQGITRVVPARELSLSEIRRMKEETGLEIECFVHGALCYCYSGQCLLSSMIGGRSGNRGQCAQPCRLPYHVEGGKAADLMSLKDLCTIDILPELMENGIDSFKIEGRMKQPDYVYTVTRMYRKYADLYLEKGAKGYKVAEADRAELLSAYRRRGYTDGYYRRHNGKEMISFRRPDEFAEEDQSPEYKMQEKINGYLILSLGKRAKLVLEYQELRIECEGETVQAALRQPLDRVRTEKQMRKTGNTEFQFERFRVETDGDVFLPIQALNELRRKGIQELTESILSKYRRKEPEAVKDMSADRICEDRGESQVQESRGNEKESQDRPKKKALSLMVQSGEQLRAALTCAYVDIIYIDGPAGFGKDTAELIGRIRKKCKCFLAMPYIFRSSDAGRWEKYYAYLEEGCDGVLIRNWESFRWLKRHGYKGEIRSDANLYVFNRYGKTFIEKQGIGIFTVPAELNAGELKTLGIREGVLPVYGYQPVMVTANCIRKTTGKCSKDGGYLYLRDRYQKRFAVQMCCRGCYNIIYNSAPLFLADKAEEIRRLEPRELRLDFTIETGEELRQVIELYADAFICGKTRTAPKTEYTRGHFKRGVR